MSTAPPPPSPPQPGYGYEPQIAAPLTSAGRRFLAYLLDSLLALVTLYIGWLIWSIIIWKDGVSPAKQMMGMRCVSLETGRAADRGTMAVRELVGKWILGTVTFGITTIVSCFMILGADRQGIWDKIAKTTVVDDPNGTLIG